MLYRIVWNSWAYFVFLIFSGGKQGLKSCLWIYNIHFCEEVELIYKITTVCFFFRNLEDKQVKWLEEKHKLTQHITEIEDKYKVTKEKLYRASVVQKKAGLIFA